MAIRKKFGERNKALSEQLLNDKIYFDWVVTTAFYSSIHFVEDAIFPTKINNVECKNIAEVKRAYNLEGRHAAREKLVFDKLDMLVGARYKWLDDNSRNARYKTYKIQSSIANKAKEYLDYIQQHCYPVLT
jgi:uncharacterized protein YutD